MEKPPRPHKRKHNTIGHDIFQLGQPSHPTSTTEIAALLDGGTGGYIPGMTQTKRNSQPRSPELTSRLRKGGIEIVDLVNEDWKSISRTPSKTHITKKSPPGKGTRTRVSITSSKPSYSYTSMDLPDLSILTPNAKTDDGSLPSPNTLIPVKAPVDLTGSPQTLLFGSGDFVGSDLGYGFVGVAEPVATNSSHTANGYEKDFESVPPSSPPLQSEGEKNFSLHPPKARKNLNLIITNNPGEEKQTVSNWGASTCLYFYSTLTCTNH